MREFTSLKLKALLEARRRREPDYEALDKKLVGDIQHFVKRHARHRANRSYEQEPPVDLDYAHELDSAFHHDLAPLYPVDTSVAAILAAKPTIIISIEGPFTMPVPGPSTWYTLMRSQRTYFLTVGDKKVESLDDLPETGLWHITQPAGKLTIESLDEARRRPAHQPETKWEQQLQHEIKNMYNGSWTHLELEEILLRHRFRRHPGYTISNAPATIRSFERNIVWHEGSGELGVGTNLILSREFYSNYYNFFWVESDQTNTSEVQEWSRVFSQQEPQEEARSHKHEQQLIQGLEHIEDKMRHTQSDDVIDSIEHLARSLGYDTPRPHPLDTSPAQNIHNFVGYTEDGSTFHVLVYASDNSYFLEVDEVIGVGRFNVLLLLTKHTLLEAKKERMYVPNRTCKVCLQASPTTEMIHLKAQSKKLGRPFWVHKKCVKDLEKSEFYTEGTTP